MNSVDRAIWTKFHIHSGDVPPFIGFEGTRETLAALFADLGYKKGAEIGVQRGAFSEIMCKANPGLKLLAVDPWAPFTHHSQSWQDHQLARAHSRLDKFDVEFMRMTSVEAAGKVPDASLDFVYIDAMHDFDSVMQDIILWSPKVRRDGIVSGHDYEHMFTCGVPRAVDAYAQAHAILPYYITPKDPPRSWFWRKP